ncbi:MAG: histidine phosphatase family protein [Rhodospirillales bacterium]|nr:histidine phosphatase family protein [Rhodospirillales bacterium]
MKRSLANDFQMGKRFLYILRHAEAAFNAESDRIRPLTDKGKSDAKTLGQRLKQAGYNLDYVLCSPARRTKETLDALALDCAAIYPENLYNALASEIYECIQTAPPSCESLLVVAHNPGVGDLVRFLTGKMMCFAPGALARLEIKAEDWESLMPGDGHLVDVI